jgi:FAD synthetase
MGKILNYKDLKKEIQQIKTSGYKLVLVGGCFDVIHHGHLTFFKKAKELKGNLVVLVESDESVRQLKGKGRPIHPQNERAKVLSYIQSVDYILPIPQLKSDREYFDLVKIIEPDIIAITRGDPIVHKKQAQASEVNARLVEVMDRDPNYSTTNLAKDL